MNTGTLYKLRSWAIELDQAQIAALVLVPIFVALLLTQSFVISLAAFFGLLSFLLICRTPQYGLYLMILSVPVQDKIKLSGNLNVTQAVTVLAVACWYLNRTATRQPLFPRPVPYILPFFLAYITALLLSVGVATDAQASLGEISRWLVTLLAFVLTISLINTRRQLWQLVFVLCLGGTFEAALGFYQNRVGAGPESFVLGDGTSRSFGTFFFPNPFAAYLEMSLPLLLAVTLWAWKRRRETTRAYFALAGQERTSERKAAIKFNWLLIACAIATLLVVQGVINSQSRGAWLGLLTGLAAMLLVRGRKSLGWLAIIGLLAAYVYLGFSSGILPSAFVSRITSIADQFTPFDVRGVFPTPENFAVVERMAMWQAGGNMFLSNPFFGVGTGNFDAVYNNFNVAYWPYSRGHAHNYYIHAAAETGLIGLTAWLFVVGAILRYTWNTVRRTVDPTLKYLAWGSLGIAVATCFHDIVENLHVLNLGIQWMGVLALCYVVRKLDGFTIYDLRFTIENTNTAKVSPIVTRNGTGKPQLSPVSKSFNNHKSGLADN